MKKYVLALDEGPTGYCVGFILPLLEICLATIGVCVFRALTSVGALFVLEEKMDIYRVSFIGHRYIDRLRLIEEKIQEIAVCAT